MYLVKAGLMEASRAYGVEQAEGTKAVDVGCVLCYFEGHFYVALSSKVVHLGRANLADDAAQTTGVGQIAIMQNQPFA